MKWVKQYQSDSIIILMESKRALSSQGYSIQSRIVYVKRMDVDIVSVPVLRLARGIFIYFVIHNITMFRRVNTKNNIMPSHCVNKTPTQHGGRIRFKNFRNKIIIRKTGLFVYEKWLIGISPESTNVTKSRGWIAKSLTQKWRAACATGPRVVHHPFTCSHFSIVEEYPTG